MANSIEQLAKYFTKEDLTGQDIRQLTGKSPVIYSALAHYKTLNDLIGQEKFCVILYQTSSKTNGHWCAIMVNNQNEIVYWDSYGLKYDTEQQKGATYDIILPMYLTNLINNDGRKITWNTFDYQKWSPVVSTCGRWASVAVRFLRFIPFSVFNQLFTTNTSNILNQPDITVSLLTLLSLHDIPKYFNK